MMRRLYSWPPVTLARLRGVKWSVPVVLSCLTWHSLSAQYEVGPADSDRFQRYLAREEWSPLNCHVTHWTPRLDYAFRFQAGYYLNLPLKQYSGEKNVLQILTRITPEHEGAESKDLVQQFRLPPVPEKTRAVLDVDGGFMVGEGRYRVEFLMADNRGRGCRAHWTFGASRNHEERDVKVAIDPDGVEALNRLRWSDALPPEPSAPKLTVMLDATPLNPSSPKMHYYDRMLLLNSLVSMMQHVHYSAVHVVAFNLDRQEILFDEPKFDENGFRRLSRVLDELQLAALSVHVLADATGHLRLLAKLMNEEATASDPSRAVIFLGPASRIQDHFPAPMLEHPTSMPPVYYLEYHPFWIRNQDFADVLRNLTQTCQGKTFHIHSPGELASAIEVLNRALGQDRRAAASVSLNR
jgi:hypothetical protein